MVRKEGDEEGEASETPKVAKVQHTGVSGGTNATQMPPYTASALQALQGGQHLSILDPNLMMMTNAAATIAAVAATAVQQISHGNNSPLPPSSAGAPASSITPALISALRSGGAAAANPKTSVSSQVAALLAATGGAHPALQLQGSTSSISGHLRQVLNSTDPSALHPATSATTLTPASTTAPTISGMQSWTVEQLEKHVSLLQQLNQPVPQSVALLLADAQRKEKKKTAKRAANRKSASTSRARKKALVEEMTRTNARLKRQALILALLPDLVIATTLEGEITFCSDQVQRELGHKTSELLGAPLYKLLAPASRDALKKLIQKLTNPGKPGPSRQPQPSQGRRGTKRRHSNQKDNGNAVEIKNNEKSGKGSNSKSGRGSSRASGGNSGETSGAAVVSEQSFPLSVVNVESKRSASSNGKGDTSEATTNNGNVNSDNSTSNNSGSGSKQQVSSLSNATGLSRSPTESQSEDDGAQGGSHGTSQGSKDKDNVKGKQHNSSDDSSLSSDAKNMSKANDNLDRNVRWHNQRMMEDSQKAKSDDGPKDDVTGASVTANNASARLSSLQHVPEVRTKKEEKAPGRYENNGDQSSSDDSLLAGVEEKKKVENASDDSGYRESNDSREETSSSGSDSSNSNDQQKPLAPTCRLCLIREDLSTVWCEVTSSLRTRSPEEDQQESQTNESKGSVNVAIDSPKATVKEVLLCLRPIRDGEKKVDESLRFVAPQTASSEEVGLVEGQVSSSSGAIDSSGPDKGSSDKTSSGDGSNTNSTSSDPTDAPKRPPKKRPMGSNQTEDKSMVSGKKAKVAHSMTAHPASDTEKSVVESLMLMNKSH